LLLNGCTLGSFDIYDQFDYLIKLAVPFGERKKRVIQREDAGFDENTMTSRDVEFKEAQEKATRSKKKKIDIVIQNTRTKEALQKIADKIYQEQIQGRVTNNREEMKEKYGGYKTKTIDRTAQLKTYKKEKDDLNK